VATADYSYAQLEQLWINAGGSKAMAPVMAAIAEAESSGDPTAYNSSGATGLWQILGAVNPSDQPDLTDPVVNAHEAVLKYQSQGLDAWVTYTNGAYRAFLSDATPPTASGVPTATAAGVPAGTLAVTTAATAGAAAAAAAGDAACLITVPVIDLKVTSVGGGCLVTKSEARAVIGGMVMAAAGLIILPGLIIIAASAFVRSGAAGALAGAAGPLEGTYGYGHAIRYARSRGSS
jgi:hypothetical protein